MKECSKCKKEKSLSEFGNNKTKKDGKQHTCRTCAKEQQKECYNKDKIKYLKRVKKQTQKCIDFIDEYKSKCSCYKCGENRYWILDFHHIDPKQKEFNIGTLRKSGMFTKIQIEIEKCVVLCKNCHYDFHHKERNENMVIEKYINI